MAIIQVYAIPASFSDGIMSVRLSLVAAARGAKIESNKVDEVVAEMEQLRDQLVGENPAQGLYINARVVSGRKPNGFKKLNAIHYKPAA